MEQKQYRSTAEDLRQLDGEEATGAQTEDVGAQALLNGSLGYVPFPADVTVS